jgi:hypothetical protein
MTTDDDLGDDLGDRIGDRTGGDWGRPDATDLAQTRALGPY